MITVACVNHGDYQGCGEQYVATLQAMVARNLSQPFEFVCIKEAGMLEGWWVKVALFEPGRFEGRVLYLDLDSVVVGSLDELATHKGCIYMRDWGWADDVLNSSVMVWDAGEHAEVFTKYNPYIPRHFPQGDDLWMTHLGGWEALPPQMCRSYRYHCREGIPEGCVVVGCHGRPKPHEVQHKWLGKYWRIA